MAAQTNPPSTSDHASTFRARGVAVPFTTPMLAGTRVREADRKGIELVIPNPSGGLGVYVVRPANIRTFCLPTAHDALLLQRLSKLKTVTPPQVRQVALRIAGDGHAGRPAMAAAENSLAMDAVHRARTCRQLMAGIVEEVTPGQPCGPNAPDLPRRADGALRNAAPYLRCPPERLVGGVQALADAFAPVGFAHHGSAARLPRLLERIQQTTGSLATWIEDDPVNDIAGLASAVIPAFRAAWETGCAVLALARGCLGNAFQLLKRWVADPRGVLSIAARAEWLLDGWDHACLLWLTAEDDSARRAALLELPQMVPVLPRECIAWTDIRIKEAATEPPCRVISREDGWRNGAAAYGLIERNERLRARSL